VFAPLSIPSPDYAWQVFNLGQWIRDIGFPGFGFNLNIHAYAVCILIGIVAAGFLTNYRLTRRGAEPGVVLDIIIWAVPLGIVGARIFHVLTHPDDYFYEGADLLRVLYVWEGGIAIFGSLIGGAIGAWIGCRFSGIRFWTFADAVAPALLLAQAFGRFGNWFNHELFGQPTDLPWGLEIETTNAAYPVGLPEGTLFHPTFLYEIVWNLVGFALILVIERKMRLQWGKVLGLYLVWYGLGRTVFESIRIDPSEVFFGLRSNVWAAIFAVILGIVIIAVQNRRHTGLEPSPYVPGRGWVNPGTGVESNDTYSDTDEPGNDAASSTEDLATSGPATSGSAHSGVGAKS
jgi:prolipoprotein diacylglyceryl transferase